MVFRSSYEQKDGKITVTIVEYYKVIDVPIAEYNEYKKVINAAADFNKITLVFEPKG